MLLNQSSAGYLTTCALLVLCAGCHSRHGLVPVSGVVTLDGGNMPAAGSVQFLPIEPAEGFPLRPGTGEFDRDGKFEAMSYTEGDGLNPGKYRVCIQCWKVKPSMDGPPPVSYVRAEYLHANTSGMELVVEPGSSPITFNVPLTSKQE